MELVDWVFYGLWIFAFLLTLVVPNILRRFGFSWYGMVKLVGLVFFCICGIMSVLIGRDSCKSYFEMLINLFH